VQVAVLVVDSLLLLVEVLVVLEQELEWLVLEEVLWVGSLRVVPVVWKLRVWDYSESIVGVNRGY
jgi:hypothetical protein